MVENKEKKLSKPKVIIIAGPTASGKTKLSIELAKEINGEIISADSMQVYKYMDIGTAKPTKEEMQGIKHYLLDEVSPDEDFNVVKYKEKALLYISEILKKGKMPIIVGGTGLYINSLLYNIEFSETICDWDFRNRMQEMADEHGNDYLYEKLKKIDPISAERIHSNNVKRVIRALEVYEFTGIPISEYQEKSRLIDSEYDFYVFGLNMDREKLYERINKRVDIMINDGLVEEVKSIIDMGFKPNSTAMQAIGYKEIIEYFNGNISIEEAIDIIKRDSRRYAKRQITWFKKTECLKWVDMDNNIKEIIKNIMVTLA